MVGADRPTAVRLTGASWRTRDDNVIRRIGNTVGSDAGDHLRKARDRIGNEVSVLIGPEQRNLAHVVVGQQDAEHVPRLDLEFGPGSHATIAALDQVAGGHRPTSQR